MVIIVADSARLAGRRQRHRGDPGSERVSRSRSSHWRRRTAGSGRLGVARAPCQESGGFRGAGRAGVAARAAGQERPKRGTRCARRCGSRRPTGRRCSKRRPSICARVRRHRRWRSCAAPSTCIRGCAARSGPVFVGGARGRPPRRLLCRHRPRQSRVVAGVFRACVPDGRRRRRGAARLRGACGRAARSTADERRCLIGRLQRENRWTQAYQVWLNSLPAGAAAARRLRVQRRLRGADFERWLRLD